MAIVELGHIGFHVNDLPGMVDFYTRIMGLQITDRADELGIVFLSSRPEVEHHELLLARGRDTPREITFINQISWRTETLEGLQGLHRALVSDGVAFRSVTHGNAISLYFADPEGNKSEIYWRSGLDVPQPFSKTIDLGVSTEAVLAENDRLISAGGPAY